MKKEKVLLRTPITYYGGKQQLCTTILSLIPEHTLYCEPFCGGAAVFFGKPKSKVEVLNDTNKELINFYKVVQNDFVSLEKEVRITLHSRSMHSDAFAIYSNPHLFSDIKRAWALWILANQSHTSILNNSWGYERADNKISLKTQNKKQAFTEELAIRLQNVQIESADACYIINSRDYEGAFHYVDPPYVGSCQGHYDGYTDIDFDRLLMTLSKVKGKFLLSSFPHEILTKYIKEYGWFTKQIIMNSSASGSRKKKTEVLTANYEI